MKTLIAILAFTLALSATPVTLTSVNGLAFGNDFVSPYDLNIDGQSYAALCFDFQDPSFIGQTWNANIDTLPNVTYFTNQSNYLTKYLAEVELFTKITAPGITPTEQVALQLAAWSLFSNVSPTSPLSLFYEQAALNAVVAGLPGIDTAPFRFVESPNGVSPLAQGFVIEVLTPTPDVKSYASVGLGLIFVGFLIRRSARR